MASEGVAVEERRCCMQNGAFPQMLRTMRQPCRCIDMNPD